MAYTLQTTESRLDKIVIYVKYDVESKGALNINNYYGAKRRFCLVCGCLTNVSSGNFQQQFKRYVL